MTDSQYLEILKEKQPFVSSSVSDPKDHIFPDVPSINSDVYHSLINLIRNKSQHPSMPLAAVVQGEAGDGKTHLINRLIRNREKSKQNTYQVAYIQPIEDPDQTYTYLLREIVTNLFVPLDNNRPATIMHGILANLVKPILAEATFNDKNLKKRIHTIIETDPVNIFFDIQLSPSMWTKIESKLKNQFSTLCSASLIHVLMQLRHSDRLFAIIEWLKCTAIDAVLAKSIHVTPSKLLTIKAQEQAARDMIKDLSVLIGSCHYPLLVCFDRLENLESGDQIRSFGRMVEFLVDDARAMMPVAFCRGDLWTNILKNQLNSHVVGRLESNQFELPGCDSEQSLELIASRLSWAYGHFNHNYFPFPKDKLDNAFRDRLRSPRVVLQKANMMLRDYISFVPRPIIEQLHDQFRNQYQKVLNTFDRFSPERSRIKRALRLFFEIKDFAVDISTGDKYIDFLYSQEISSKKGCVIIDLQHHHKSVGASLKRGVDSIKNNPDAYVLYIRDERCLLPAKWKSTNAVLNQFKKLGGHFLMLDRNEAAQCYAIALMNYAIKEGDISVETSAFDMEKASIESFLHFLHEYIGHEPFSLFKKIADILQLRKKKVPGGGGGGNGRKQNQIIMNKTLECLRPQPMMMASTGHILDYLTADNIKTSQDEMMRVIKRFGDRFVIHQSKTDTIVMIKKEWINAQP